MQVYADRELAEFLDRTMRHTDFGTFDFEVIALDLKGCAVSTGAACSSGTVEPSHVLIAMGLKPERVQGSIRVSLGRYTKIEEIVHFVDVLTSVVGSIRQHAHSGAVQS